MPINKAALSAHQMDHFLAIGARIIDGFQLRYIKFLDESYRSRLTVPVLDYSEIDKHDARMYKGAKPCVSNVTVA